MVGLGTTCEVATGVALVSALGEIASVNVGTNGSSMSPSIDAGEVDPPGIAPECLVSLVPQSLEIKPTICPLDTLGVIFSCEGSSRLMRRGKAPFAARKAPSAVNTPYPKPLTI